MRIIALCVAFFLFNSFSLFSFATNKIIQGQIVRDGQSIISADKKFELGFFSTVNSTYRFVGIWYRKVPKQSVIWVANRNNPISNNDGLITLNENGNLVIFDGNRSFVWSSNSSSANNATVVLKNNGNLIRMSSIGNKKLWESFNYSTDTFLPCMKVHSHKGATQKSDFIVGNRDLVDMQQLQAVGYSNAHVSNSNLGIMKNKIFKVVIIVAMVVVFFIGVFVFLVWKFRKSVVVSWRMNQVTATGATISTDYSIDFLGNELICGQRKTIRGLNFTDIVTATDNFSDHNMLGKGGFGPVYKGNLFGEEIAVKRHSKESRQGLEEFENEVILIAKLQHINLVRILGCCIEGDERILVYEYMLNKSLDSFIFDAFKQSKLDWQKRFAIIKGIAHGLVYLHWDSRLRIIHRDLKASNILLDDEMNPKISDFGISKILGENVNEASTNRIVGTFGYMAPEYSMKGLFSDKTDVYSFGVLLFEIISGRRNISFISPEGSNIIDHAWDMWYNNKGMELVDPSIFETCNKNQVLRCIHIAMLCVQDLPDHRPTMSSVVIMLEIESVTLPMPREPKYKSIGLGNVNEGGSLNYVTNSVIIGR